MTEYDANEAIQTACEAVAMVRDELALTPGLHGLGWDEWADHWQAAASLLQDALYAADVAHDAAVMMLALEAEAEAEG